MDPKDLQPTPQGQIPSAAIPKAAIPGQAPAPTSAANNDALPAPTADQSTVTNPGADPIPADIQAADPYSGKNATPTGIAALLANKKLLIIVGGGLAFLVLLIIVVAATAGNSPSTKRNNTSNSTSALPEVVSRPDGTLDLSRRVKTSEVIRAQKIQAGANQQVNLSSGLSLIVQGIGNYTSGTASAGNGKKFIIILLSAGNHSLDDNISLSYLDFKLLDKNGALLSPHTVTRQIENNPIKTPVELKPAKETEGRLVYEVGLEEQSWTLVNKQTYNKTSDNTTFSVEANISLKLSDPTGEEDDSGSGPSGDDDADAADDDVDSDTTI